MGQVSCFYLFPFPLGCNCRPIYKQCITELLYTIKLVLVESSKITGMIMNTKPAGL